MTTKKLVAILVVLIVYLGCVASQVFVGNYQIINSYKLAVIAELLAAPEVKNDDLSADELLRDISSLDYEGCNIFLLDKMLKNCVAVKLKNNNFPVYAKYFALAFNSPCKSLDLFLYILKERSFEFVNADVILSAKKVLSCDVKNEMEINKLIVKFIREKNGDVYLVFNK